MSRRGAGEDDPRGLRKWYFPGRSTYCSLSDANVGVDHNFRSSAVSDPPY